MATKYVRTNGNDGGSGHDGSTPALAWLTIGYAMTNASAGDTIYVGAGTYRISSTIAPTSMGSMTYLYGDPDGSQTGDAGEVLITTYGTNDTTVPSNINVFTFASKNYWTVGKFSIMSGLSGGVSISGTSANLTFQDLQIWSETNCIFTAGVTFGTVQNIIIERCRLWTAQGASPLYIQCPSSASGSDTNMNVIVRNCIIPTGQYAVYIASDINRTWRSGGITIANCFINGASSAILISDAYVSTTYKTYVYNCYLSGGNACSVGQANTLTEDYNVICAATAYVNVTQGANTIIDKSRAWRFSLSHEVSYGANVRRFCDYPAGSPLLTWGGSTATGVPTDDLTGITRPASGAGSVNKALGPLERSNSGTKETSTVRTGSSALKISGPGYHDFDLPVSAASTTVTVYVRWDATYAGTKPSMAVRNGGECGVANASTTATGSSGSWEQLSLNFTPTSAGIVTIRLTSSDTNGGGAAYWDDFAVI